MKPQQLESQNVKGLAVRTKNADEMNPASAKIATLWWQFYAQIFANLAPEQKIYGIYYNYESDYSGEFNVLAGAQLDQSQLEKTKQASIELEQVSIEAGKYLTFSGTGTMPATVISVWGEIWNYFSAEDCPHQRAYLTDFECYQGTTQVDIYIGIK